MTDYISNPDLIPMHAGSEPLMPLPSQQPRRQIRVHTDDPDSEDEIQSDDVPADEENALGRSAAERVAAGEVPMDILERQMALVPVGAYVLTE